MLSQTGLTSLMLSWAGRGVRGQGVVLLHRVRQGSEGGRDSFPSSRTWKGEWGGVVQFSGMPRPMDMMSGSQKSGPRARDNFMSCH